MFTLWGPLILRFIYIINNYTPPKRLIELRLTFWIKDILFAEVYCNCLIYDIKTHLKQRRVKIALIYGSS